MLALFSEKNRTPGKNSTTAGRDKSHVWIRVRTCYMNSTSGSVVPLAMFGTFSLKATTSTQKLKSCFRCSSGGGSLSGVNTKFSQNFPCNQEAVALHFCGTNDFSHMT